LGCLNGLTLTFDGLCPTLRSTHGLVLTYGIVSLTVAAKRTCTVTLRTWESVFVSKAEQDKISLYFPFRSLAAIASC